MSHETQQKILDFLRAQPGKNGGDIARALGLRDSTKISHDIVRLRKGGAIRREGGGGAARWYVVEGMQAPLPQRRGFQHGYRAHKHACAYHLQNGRGGPLYCARCAEAGDAARRGNEAKLRRLFPKIFSTDKPSKGGAA